MARLEPTVARLIRPEWALQVPSPAHDALAPDARRRYVAANPHSFLTVTQGPEDVEPPHLWDSARAVTDSRAALERLMEAGAFSEPAGPALYLYRLRPSGDAHRNTPDLTGIVGNVAVDDYDRGVIRVHEQVDDARAQHLADHLGGLGIQSSPVTLAHRADPALTALVDRLARAQPPELDFVSPDGLHQQVWRVDGGGAVMSLRAALAEVPLYVIDGHHRSAAAARHRARRGEPGAADWMLAVVFPADRLRVEAFHRVLHGVHHDRLVELVGSAHPVRTVGGIDDVEGRLPSELALLTGDRWHLVDLGPGPGGLESLDAVRLARRVLHPLLALSATSPGDRLSYRAGTPSPEDLAQWRTADGEALWLLRPVPIDLVLDAADDGLIMPPKSTFFQPKARSGVFLRTGL